MLLWLYLLVGMRNWIQRKVRAGLWASSAKLSQALGLIWSLVSTLLQSIKSCQRTQHHTHRVSKSFCPDELGDWMRCEENQRSPVHLLTFSDAAGLSLPHLRVLFVWVRINSYSKVTSVVLRVLMHLIVSFSVGYFSLISPMNPSWNDCLNGGLIPSPGKGEHSCLMFNTFQDCQWDESTDRLHRNLSKCRNIVLLLRDSLKEKVKLS